MLSKDFTKVAELYCATIPTFTSFSVFSFNDFVKYAVISSIMTQSRSNIKRDLVNSSDVEMSLLEMPTLRQLLSSFDECRYRDFFLALLDLEPILKQDPYLLPSVSLIIGELRLKAYQQFLDSFKWYDSRGGVSDSCTLQSMADSFGVSTPFINSELARFISEGRIQAKIDRVGMRENVESR